MPRRWLILSVYTAALLFATHVPLRFQAKPRTDSWLDTLLVSIERLARGTMPGGFGRGDKLFHAVAYAGLAWLVFRALEKTPRPLQGSEHTWRLSAFWIVTLLIGFGLLDETTQPLTGRTLDWLDFTANTVGILCVALWMLILDAHSRLSARPHLEPRHVHADS